MESTERVAGLVIHLPLSRARRRRAGPAAAPRRLLVDDPSDVAAAAAALGAGAVVGHPFANVYAITTRPDATTVRAANLLAGRPPRQVGSVTTTPLRLPLLLDWSRLPAPLAGHQVLGLLDALLGLGPIGFRGPAAAGVPAHLIQVDSGVRTVQVVSPGHACPSSELVLERHGSLPAEQVREVVDGFGFDLALGPHARHRLPERDHAAVGA